ncbi:hypothetical protein L107_10748 [Cyanobium sp. Copco_Reservoir_LC18]|uniref:DUF3172 domain-containing protein n=1 Tax=Cyanobium sp. Copco_Reservoir_LC18 TaxID=1328305 RepID=UPI00135AE7F9|nr:DUF3172 domain-containing protein [Cyanobium sp. Copco_Reservoir_LC18]KAF0653129.1 hypothetical protein L107_10748 [Cyanobium sp. Copco_Reservoir_LC18]
MTRSRSSAGRPEPGGYAPRPDRYEPRTDRRSDRYDDRSDRFSTGYGGREDPRYGTPGRRGSNGGGGRPPAGNGGGPSGGGPAIQLNVATVAVLAGVLVVGIGIGSAVTSTTQGNQGNIASAQQLDMAVPDPEFCKQWGASAFVMDIELYTTMNPSSSFVTQPTLQPGCVIRRENWSVLQKEGAVTAEQMRQCKQRMNTFAYIGSVRDKPIVRCVYQTDITGNKFQTRGVAGAADDAVGITPEADQF